MPYQEKLTDTRWGWCVEMFVDAAIVAMLVIAIVA
jgi:hypothetical protein